jgi:hypothetical protein
MKLGGRKVNNLELSCNKHSQNTVCSKLFPEQMPSNDFLLPFPYIQNLAIFE